jgi:hypothetical protein
MAAHQQSASHLSGWDETCEVIHLNYFLMAGAMCCKLTTYTYATGHSACTVTNIPCILIFWGAVFTRLFNHADKVNCLAR